MAQEAVSEADEFAARLSLALRAFNLSRSQLSATLGVHKSLVSRWLSGQVVPTSYNLARISAEFARLRPGFNMTAWTAPRAEFEAALGLHAASAVSPARATAFGEPDAAGTVAIASSTGHLPNRWMVYATVAAVLLVAVGTILLWRSAQPTPMTAIQAAPPAAASVAVLPFVNMSGDPAKEYLGDGMAEEILNDLANTPDLRVAARTSSFSFKGRRADIGEIARKLNVRAVLEGSVRVEGDRIRVVAQLINAKDGFHLWSARYDRKLDDILAVQDKIARAIVAALTRKLAPSLPARRIDPKAYQDYLQAQYFFNQRTGSAFRSANELLKDALARQPDFTAAYALRGHVLLLFAGDDRELQDEGRKMTAAALRLNPDNQEALDTEVQRALREWNWDAAYRAGHRILVRKPRNALSYNGIAYFYQYMGFPQQALEARALAAQLDPLHFIYRSNLALSLLHVGKLQEAMAAAEAALELQPSHRLVLDELCTFNALAGKLDRAREYARQLDAQTMPPKPASALNAQDYGRQVAIRENINNVIQDCNIQLALVSEPAPNVHAMLDLMSTQIGRSDLGLFYARIGDLPAAMKAFSDAYDRRDPRLIWVRYDATTPKALFSDPRWVALWQRPLLRDWQRLHDRIAADLAHERR